MALGKTVAELLETLSYRELVQWKAFYSIEPFGAPVDDWNAAKICQVVAQGYARRPVKVTNFMRQPPKPRLTADAIKEVLGGFNT